MNLTDAAKILDLTGSITPDAAREAYRRAAKKYHPDRNPAGAEMMKLVNAAYDVLKDFSGDIATSEDATSTSASYPEAVNAALNAIIGVDGLDIEICGAWAWVGGDTYSHREALKTAGFHFASNKKRWYFRPDDWRSSSRGSYTMDDIRTKYGSDRPNLKRDYLDEHPA